MKQALHQSVSILVVSAVLGAISFALRPGLLPWDVSAHELDLAAALELPGALWVDARVAEDFEAGHFEGAVLLNEEDWERGFVGLLAVWSPDVSIVVYCSSQSCLRSHQVAERLREELGIEAAYSLRGGWEALQQAGLAEGGER